MDEFLLELINWDQEYLTVREKVLDKARKYIDKYDFEPAGDFLEISRALSDLEKKFITLIEGARS